MRGPVLLEIAIDEKQLLNEILILTSNEGLDEKKFEQKYPELFSIYKIIKKEYTGDIT